MAGTLPIKAVGTMYRGWVISKPTWGTGMKLEVTNPDKPGVAQRFDRPWQARQWIDKQEA